MPLAEDDGLEEGVLVWHATPPPTHIVALALLLDVTELEPVELAVALLDPLAEDVAVLLAVPLLDPLEEEEEEEVAVPEPVALPELLDDAVLLPEAELEEEPELDELAVIEGVSEGGAPLLSEAVGEGVRLRDRVAVLVRLFEIDVADTVAQVRRATSSSI